MRISFDSKSEIRKISKILCTAYPADIVISVDDLRNTQADSAPDLPWQTNGLHIPIQFSDGAPSITKAEAKMLPDHISPTLLFRAVWICRSFLNRLMLSSIRGPSGFSMILISSSSSFPIRSSRYLLMLHSKISVTGISPIKNIIVICADFIQTAQTVTLLSEISK